MVVGIGPVEEFGADRSRTDGGTMAMCGMLEPGRVIFARPHGSAIRDKFIALAFGAMTRLSPFVKTAKILGNV